MKAFPLALFVALAAAPAAAAPVTVRTFTVTSFDRIRVDGPFRVELSTGVGPYARARGTPQALDRVDVAVEGRTLVVRPNKQSWGGYPGQDFGPVEIALGTHDLATAWINGSGTLGIDRIRGLSFDLSVDGAGSADIGNAGVDQLKIAMSGSGTVKVAGTAPKLTAFLHGTSVLDGAQLSIKDADITANGAPTVRATVRGTARIEAQGVATVELAGGPACEVKAQGSATIRGCR